MDESRWSKTDTKVTVIGVVLLVALTFPGYALANRVDPILFGMPFSMLWIVLWILIGAVALFLVYIRDPAAKVEPGTISESDSNPRSGANADNLEDER